MLSVHSETAYKNPVIVFIPDLFTLGETLPAIKIAKVIQERGLNNIIFFDFGGKYSNLLHETDYKIVHLKNTMMNLYKKYYVQNPSKLEKLRKITRKRWEKAIFLFYKTELIEKMVDEQITILKKINADLIVRFFNPTISISAHILNIPQIVVISGTFTPLYFKSGYVTFPENYENYLTRIIPKQIKNQITTHILLHSKYKIKNFNNVAKKYKIKKFSSVHDLLLGDYNLICDDLYLLGIKPNKNFPKENFVGPIWGMDLDISNNKSKSIPEDVKSHLQKEGKKILLTMGSVCDKELYLKILNALNETNYNVIAIFNKILKNGEIPKLGENILLKKFVPSIRAINENVDIAIIHGGRGTMYTAIYSGKPIIGMPFQIEQQFNIDCIVRKGAGIRISKKFFNKNELIWAIQKIVNNYDYFYTNAKNLSKNTTSTSGDKNAAERIIEINNQINSQF